jgi:hypothetical protein
MVHPIGVVILAVVGPGAIAAFAVLHGAGFSIAKGTVPLVIFGSVGYGLRKLQPDVARIEWLMRRYVRVAALEGTAQVAMILIMSRFATGL